MEQGQVSFSLKKIFFSILCSRGRPQWLISTFQGAKTPVETSQSFWPEKSGKGVPVNWKEREGVGGLGVFGWERNRQI